MRVLHQTKEYFVAEFIKPAGKCVLKCRKAKLFQYHCKFECKTIVMLSPTRCIRGDHSEYACLVWDSYFDSIDEAIKRAKVTSLL